MQTVSDKELKITKENIDKIKSIALFSQGKSIECKINEDKLLLETIITEDRVRKHLDKMVSSKVITRPFQMKHLEKIAKTLPNEMYVDIISNNITDFLCLQSDMKYKLVLNICIDRAKEIIQKDENGYGD